MIDIETPIVVDAIHAAQEISKLRGEVRRLRASNAELLAAAQELVRLHDLGKGLTTPEQRDDAWGGLQDAVKHATEATP